MKQPGENPKIYYRFNLFLIIHIFASQGLRSAPSLKGYAQPPPTLSRVTLSPLSSGREAGNNEEHNFERGSFKDHFTKLWVQLGQLSFFIKF